ncbi:MAG: hypothetical protein GXO45_06135, partial [Aquificae bacterium]|nr:hypothetical protein [Aquificota bacterium]
FPVSKSLFRRYKLKVKDKKHIEKALHSKLKAELPLPLEKFRYRYIHRKDGDYTDIFCVLIPEEELKGLKNKVVDSEVFALLRLFLHQGKREGSILHISQDYRYLLEVKDGFPEAVKVISGNTAVDNNTYLSGKVEGEGKRLNNPTGNPLYNVCYGLLIKDFYPFGVDFNSQIEGDWLDKQLKGVLYIGAGFLAVGVGLYTLALSKGAVLKEIKEKQKEVYAKYISPNEVVIDPLTQAKGKLSQLQKSAGKTVDGAYILSKLGEAKVKAGIKEIKRVSINGGYIQIEGKADSITQIEKFKNTLSNQFDIKITQTSKTPSGQLRFGMEGRLK